MVLGSFSHGQVSKKRINWGAYKIRQNQDKVGIFVSIVATKVPFKVRVTSPPLLTTPCPH
jgi:DNA topoisomerase VI, subunit B